MKLNHIIILLLIISVINCQFSKDLDLALSLLERGNKTNQTCSDVFNVPKEDQCSFIKLHCNTDEYQISRINYISLYYCNFNSIHQLSIVPILIILLISFIGLGLTASDYLSSNLYTISKFLNLSENLAGLTLLALGNGSADILSTYKAINLGSTNLAVSELVGASMFISTIVIGSMAIIKPFKVSDRQLLRDVGFFLAITLLIFFSILIGQINLIICILLVSMYIIYVIVVVSSHTIQKYKARKRLRYLRSRNNFSNDYNEPILTNSNEIDDIFLDNFANLPSIDELDNNTVISPSDEFDNFLNQHENYTNEEINSLPVQTGSFGLKLLLKNLSRHATGRKHHIYLNDDYQRPLTAPAGPVKLGGGDQSNVQIPHTYPKAYRDDEQDTNEIQSPVITSNSIESSSINQKSLKNKISGNLLIMISLILPDSSDFQDLSYVNKLYFIICYPISIFLRISTPVRDQFMIDALNKKMKSQPSVISFNQTEDEEEEEDEDDENFDFELDKLLLVTQVFFAMNYINYMLFYESNYWIVYFLIGLIISVALSVTLYKIYLIKSIFTNKDYIKLKFMNYTCSLIGFIISILWISTFATEIINILKSFSIIFNLSDAILGITVFALGNSIGDFISNLTIAKMGMPIMAFSACFGGPLLSLSSLGLSTSIVLLNNGRKLINIEFSKTLIIISTSLIINILFILIIIPKNNWMFDRKVGAILISNWIITTLICIIVEVV